MNGVPRQKHAGELVALHRVGYANVEPDKFYYMRVRNKDSGPDVWGFKKDFVVKINKIDDVGVSAFTYYERSGDPREGVPRWEKVENMILIPTEAITKRNMEDNTTFYIKDDAKVKRTRRNDRAILNRFRTFLGLTRRMRRF